MEKIETDKKYLFKDNTRVSEIIDKINEIVDWINEHKDQLLDPLLKLKRKRYVYGNFN